jgi:superfamily II DNA/RNA helicase
MRFSSENRLDGVTTDAQQRERDQALAAFIKGDFPLMFATDVAARGLDIKGVTHVFNFDMARCGF